MINWREIPFFRLLLPFLAGIFSAVQFPVEIPFGNCLLLLFFIATTVFAMRRQQFGQRWLYGALASVFLFLLGFQLAFYQNDRLRADFFGQYLLKEKCTLTGVIERDPVRKEKTKAVLAVEFLTTDSLELLPVSGKILLYLDADSARPVRYGDRLAILATATQVAGFNNPDAFDYRRFLALKNIHYQAFVRNGNYQILESNRGSWWTASAITFKEKFLKTLRKYLKNPDEFAVASALTIGYQDEISEEVKGAYVASGAMHLLAVSGLHVGMIFLFVEFVLKRVKSRRRYWKLAKTAILLAVIWLFALVTGATPSVLRAATMFSFIIAGNQLNRDNNIYNTLAVSAFFLLLIDPYLLFQVGFQLSYLAVLGIVYLHPKIYALWLIDHKIGDHFWELTSIGIAAQIATLPFSLFYFHQFPVYFWLSGILVVDAAAVILGLGFLLFFTDFVLPAAGRTFGACLDCLVWLVNEVIFLIEQLPGSVIPGIWMGSVGLLLLCALFVCIAGFVSFKKFGWVTAAAACLLGFGLNYAVQNYLDFRQKELTIYNTPRSFLMDVVERQQIQAFGSDSLPAKAVEFAAEAHRFALGASGSVPVSPMSDTATVRTSRFFKKGNFFQFCNRRFAMMDGNIAPPTEPLRIDYLILSGNANVSIEALRNCFQFTHVIADNTNAAWRINHWQEECTRLGVPLHSVRTDGAFVVEGKR